jgi:predicted transcriptional regulator
MEVIELKFLLKLLGFEGYRAKTTPRNLSPNQGTNASDCNRICRNLGDRGYVGYKENVKNFKITSLGKQVLNTDTSSLPINKEELKVLKTGTKKDSTPSNIKIPKEKKQPIIRSLIARGLIRGSKLEIHEIWLTESGKQYLLKEYAADSTTPSISTKLLTNYLKFMRQAMQIETAQPVSAPVNSDGSDIDTTTPTLQMSDSDEEILQTIRDLDRELGTQNYLPIYHLRQKLQPPMSRDKLDETLYRLQRHDRIELSSLQETKNYNSEQINAAIHREFGKPLFFIIIV